MIALYFLIGALALLVTILLLGFVGCDTTAEVAVIVAEYPNAVKATDGLIGYWRLGEPNTTPVPSSGGAARSEVGVLIGNTYVFHHGDYSRLSPVTTPNDQLHSPATAPTPEQEIVLGAPNLLVDPDFPIPPYTCIDIDGGYVQVPWNDNLNPTQFTFEAWVHPALLDSRYFYCLAESTGPQGLGPRKTGWGLYLGPSDIDNPEPAGSLFWQVWMGNGNQFNRVAIAKPGFTRLDLASYLALTFNGIDKLQLWVYFPGMDLNSLEIPALDILRSPSDFQRNDATADGQGDFFIGSGSNLTSIPFSVDRLYPFKGKIQEVALYNRDLSAPHNAGVQEILAGHVASGADL